MSTGALNGTSLALSVAAAVFLGISCLGYSKEGSVLENVPWFTINLERPGVGDFADVYAGLYGIYIISKVPGVNEETVQKFDEDSECGRNGKGAFAMMIVGCVFAASTAVLSGVSICAKTFAVQMASLVACLISFATSLVGVGLFMGNCFASTADEDDSYFYNFYPKWGAGSILGLVGMLLMFIVSILQIVASCLGTGAGYAPPPASAPTAEMAKY